MKNLDIINLCSHTPLDGNVYLLHVLSKNSGLFACNRKLQYLIRDNENLVFENIETEFLSLNTHIQVIPVVNTSSFDKGIYNIITYKGTFEDDSIRSFIELCKVYSKNETELPFKEFFYSLIQLFQLPTEQIFKNAIGLYGELKFMQYLYRKFNFDISNFWHVSRSNSQFDFTYKNNNFEIKTTLSNDCIFRIKHNQIFNEHICYLITINIERVDDGETIFDVIENLQSIPNAFSSVNFNIGIAKELKRISPIDANTVKFKLQTINVYNADNINPFNNLPDNIKKLEYYLDLTDATAISDYQIKPLLLD